MRELGPMNSTVAALPLAAPVLAPARQSRGRGSGDFSPLWAGQNAATCKRAPAGAITRELARAL